ncbi:hypothetical protein GCM10007231_28010 [Nocardioides daphniae]|uniref:Uncharacterized protein n=1 Tax=Nocardioides daphniae TaxID=402297 RepID=A0ABQ1QIW5_9ACTN|nr:hypothetical protein GCM10007231_28010 [Nocardioides daphniae]
MPHGDDEVGAGEDVHLAELHPFLPLQVAGRAQHGEEHVAVALDLRPLVGGDGVLDGQVVDPNSAATDRIPAASGRYRPIHAMPCCARSTSYVVSSDAGSAWRRPST